MSLYFRNCSEPLIPIHVFVVLDTLSKENIYFRTNTVKGENKSISFRCLKNVNFIIFECTLEVVFKGKAFDVSLSSVVTQT